MAAVQVPDAATDDIEAVVSGLGVSADAATGHVQAASQRCNAISGVADVSSGLALAHVVVLLQKRDGNLPGQGVSGPFSAEKKSSSAFMVTPPTLRCAGRSKQL